MVLLQLYGCSSVLRVAVAVAAGSEYRYRSGRATAEQLRAPQGATQGEKAQEGTWI
jgi:hypothetical protein